MSNKTIPEQVGDLIEQAFKLFDGHSEPLKHPKLERAVLMVHAANALATLALGQETRVTNLLAAAAHPPEGTNPDLVREAYTAAVTHLGLIEPEPDDSEESLADLRAQLAGHDPADAKLGDL